jgi:large subunit ribosomal protein L14e
VEVSEISDDILGKLAISKSGRDLGKPFVVIKVINERYLLLCDGDLRKIEKPKKKNIRHVRLTSLRADEVLKILHSGGIPANHVIKKNIKHLLDNSGEGGLESGQR